MGGTQRLAERAGPARARERVIYSGALYDAATLKRWNVVNRVLPDEGFGRRRARVRPSGSANGPTRERTPRRSGIVREAAQNDGHGSDAVTPAGASGGLFATEDLRNAVASFLADGPGKATFEGR